MERAEIQVKNGIVKKTLRTLLSAALMTALLTASGMVVGASGSVSNDSPGITQGETMASQNTISITGEREAGRLYATASAVSYNSSYYGEMQNDSIAKLVYDGYVDNISDKESCDSFELSLDPVVITEGFDTGETNENGHPIISPKPTDENYVALNTSIRRGAMAFLYDHPEVYWVRNYSTATSYAISQKQDGTYELEIHQLTIKPEEAYSGATSQIALFYSGFTTAANSIPRQSGLSRYDTVKNIHDYICQHAEYDYAAASSNSVTAAHTAAPLFIAVGSDSSASGKVVCEGYSKAFKMLCDKFGIPCAVVSGTGYTGSSNEPHMWNYVQMDDGKWYGVDVTWDDMSSINYDYFLKGSNQFNSDHSALPPSVNSQSVDLVYPSLAMANYDPHWNDNQGNTNSDTTNSDTTNSDTTNSDTTNSDTTNSDTTNSDTTNSDTTNSDTTNSDPTNSDTTNSDTTNSDTTNSDTTNSDTTNSDTTNSDTTNSDTTNSENTVTQLDVPIADSNNGLVKSAKIPENAVAMAGNTQVPLDKLKVVVNTLNTTDKKTFTDAIYKLNNGFDVDNSNLVVCNIEIMDNNGNSVTITEGKIKICLTFPSSLEKKYTNYIYTVYHQKKDSSVEYIKPVSYNAQGVWFETDKFSPFALTAIEKQSTGDPSPGTGESILFTVIAAVLLVLAAGAIAFIVIKGRISDKDASSEASDNSVAEVTEGKDE